MRLDEIGGLEVLLGELGGELGYEGARDGEARQEGPDVGPLPPEEHRSQVEPLHLLRRRSPGSLLRREYQESDGEGRPGMEGEERGGCMRRGEGSFIVIRLRVGLVLIYANGGTGTP